MAVLFAIVSVLLIGAGVWGMVRVRQRASVWSLFAGTVLVVAGLFFALGAFWSAGELVGAPGSDAGPTPIVIQVSEISTPTGP